MLKACSCLVRTCHGTYTKTKRLAKDLVDPVRWWRSSNFTPSFAAPVQPQQLPKSDVSVTWRHLCRNTNYAKILLYPLKVIHIRNYCITEVPAFLRSESGLVCEDLLDSQPFLTDDQLISINCNLFYLKITKPCKWQMEVNHTIW